MKKLKKLLIIAMLAVLTSSYAIPVLAESTKKQTLYTLPTVANMSLTGTNRGNWHDRQNLGIYMKAGASF